MATVFSKHAGDQWTRSIDFSGRLPEGVTITAVEVKAYDLDHGSDSTSDVLGAPGFTDTTVSVLLNALTNRFKQRRYALQYKATGSNSNVFIETEEMRIKR